MLAATLHSIGRQGPHTGLEIYLAPPSPDHLAGSRGGLDRELERARCDTFSLAQISHEGANLAVWQRRVVHNLADFRSRREQLVEVTTPTSRVVTLPEASDSCPVEDHFDPATDSARGLGLYCPNRLHDFHNQRGIDSSDGQLAEDRGCVGPEGVCPL